jgi:3-oxoacyl-[acyl-carrier-protein] synthase-3
VPLTVTQGKLSRPRDRSLSLLMLGYGVGLSWGSALVDLPADARLNHIVVPGSARDNAAAVNPADL